MKKLALILSMLLISSCARAQGWTPLQGIELYLAGSGPDFTNIITFQAPVLTTPYTLTWPAAYPASSAVLTCSTTGILSWTSASADSTFYIQNLAYPFTVLQTANYNISGYAGVGHDLTIGGNIYEPAITNASVAGWSNTGELTNTILGLGQIEIGEGSGSPIGISTLTAGSNITIDNSNPGHITISASGGNDSSRTFNTYAYETSNYIITSSSYSALLNTIVESNGILTVTLPPSIKGVELLVYTSADDGATVTVALGTGAHFFNGLTTKTLSTVQGAGERFIGVAGGYYLIQDIP